MTPPGRNAPEALAFCTMDRAARSLMDWPGFRNSALPRISQPVASDRRFRRMSGVSPMRLMMLAMDKGCLWIRSWEGAGDV